MAAIEKLTGDENTYPARQLAFCWMVFFINRPSELTIGQRYLSEEFMLFKSDSHRILGKRSQRFIRTWNLNMEISEKYSTSIVDRNQMTKSHLNFKSSTTRNIKGVVPAKWQPRPLATTNIVQPNVPYLFVLILLLSPKRREYESSLFEIRKLTADEVWGIIRHSTTKPYFAHY